MYASIKIQKPRMSWVALWESFFFKRLGEGQWKWLEKEFQKGDDVYFISSGIVLNEEEFKDVQARKLSLRIEYFMIIGIVRAQLAW